MEGPTGGTSRQTWKATGAANATDTPESPDSTKATDAPGRATTPSSA